MSDLTAEELEQGRRSLLSQLRQSLRKADLSEYPVDADTMRDLVVVLEGVRAESSLRDALGEAWDVGVSDEGPCCLQVGTCELMNVAICRIAPSVGVSDEAVEAAAAAMFTCATGIAWSQIDQASQAAGAARKEARAALEAAAPFMQSQVVASREQIDTLVTYFRAQREGCEQLRAANEETGADLTAIDYHARAETWESAADAVLALMGGAETEAGG